MNAIWSTARRRSLPHRIGLYWALLTLAPIALAAVLALNSHVIAELTRGVELVWVQSIWFAALPWLLGAAGLWLMFLLLPAVRVVPLHALVGALLSGVLLVLLQRGLGWSVRQLPTYEVVYGAFAALPLLLIWLFLAWAAVLAGALLAASLRHWSAPLDEPTLDDSPGSRFDDGVTVLRALLQVVSGKHPADHSQVIALAARSLAEHFGHYAQRAEQAAVFAFGGVLAGLAGGLAAPVRSRSPGMGFSILIESFIVTVIGGMGSVSGALLGALLIGLIRSFGTIGFPLFVEGLMFLAMVLILILRPNGLLGKETRA